jgi:hypothetical protein
LKDQAKELLRGGGAETLAGAQFAVAREYGFASWAKLKKHVESLEEIGLLKQAIDSNDLEAVQALMTRNPELHRAPLGYGKNGPLSWVAECRVPWEAPGKVRLEMAQWMIDHGSDVHQGGDGPLMRASLYDERIPMMELLVENGADVNAAWGGDYPMICTPCETVQPRSLRWLLEHGARPEFTRRGETTPETALDYLLGTYYRSAELAECMEILMEAGCRSRRNVPAAMDLMRGRMDLLEGALDADPRLVGRRFAELDFGNTGTRRMLLVGGTLLHVAAEFGSVEAARLLVEHGADVNARADADGDGVGGQTAIFHSATQFWDKGLAMTRWLVEHGADLTVRARCPGHYEREDEFVETTVLGYARRFPGTDRETVRYLEGVGARE